MRSACPTAMTTSRLTSRSLPTRSSSLDLASGRITYRSKSKLTVDAVVTFSGLGAAFAGAGGGAGGACGAGAGAGVGGGGSGVDAQPANTSRTIAESAVVQAAIFESGQAAFLDPKLSRDPHVGNVLAPRRVHEVRDRVVAGEKLGAIEGDRAEIREFPRSQEPIEDSRPS